ncbi:MAG: hypothetical protein AB7V77_05850 [Candidatus Woesearchaeota archaeon]
MVEELLELLGNICEFRLKDSRVKEGNFIKICTIGNLTFAKIERHNESQYYLNLDNVDTIELV